MKIVAFFIEILAWLRIVVSPLFIGGIIGGLVYMKWENETGFAVGILIAAIGLVVGITWATTIWYKHGTLNYMAKLSETPELNKPEQK